MKKNLIFTLLSPLLKKSYFTAAEVRELGVSTAKLAYYVNQGLIQRMSRGVYKSPQHEPCLQTFPWDDLLETSYLVPGGVICLISALALYEMTEEIPRTHWIAISHSTSSKKRKGVKIMRFRNMNLGKTVITVGKSQVPIFNQERTIIDAFLVLKS
ncbi:MAG: type IV toxin-antitoxin system AbiEi family antitoxin domain-containing protein [Candidatus Rhabdochlamydia sp.]